MPAPLTCAFCGEEVRWGWRHGRLAWLHREDVDHDVKFGNYLKPGEWDEITARLAEGLKFRTKRTNDGQEEAREETSHELEPIEVRSVPMPHKGRMFVGCSDGSVAVATVPGGTRTLLNLAAKQGWEVLRLTYSRGPYLGALGGSLGVSDSVLCILGGPVVDGGRLWAVASWRDGEADWAMQITKGHSTLVGMKALTTWIKEAPRGEDA